jgi:DNA polymerase-3 subunit epsilon
MKDQLKARGYRWNSDEAAGPKTWSISLPETDRQAELAWLAQAIYGDDPGLTPRRVTAFERFSDRI